MTKHAKHTNGPDALSEKDFVINAIRALRKESAGIHTVWSGFNQAFRDYYGKKADPVAAVDRLVADQVVTKQLRKKGAMIWIKSETPPEVVAALAALAERQAHGPKQKKAKKKASTLDKILAAGKPQSA